MPTQAEQTQYGFLRNALIDLLNYKPVDLVRNEDLGRQLNFEIALPFFHNIAALANEQDPSAVPFERLQDLTGVVDQIVSLYRQIVSLSATQANVAQNRDSLVESLGSTWKRFFDAGSPLVAYASTTSGEMSVATAQLKQALAEQESLAKRMGVDREEILQQAQSALAIVRNAAAESGVTQHAKYFQDEAKYHQRIAFSWLIATLVIAIGTIAYAVFGVAQSTDNTDPTLARVIVSLAPRLIVLFVLSFALVTASRNYAASRHNFIVNRHRQNALSSFEAFVKGASDAQTRDAVLVQATQSIFAPQDSGWTKNNPPPTPASQIVEIVRGVTKAGAEKN